MLDEEARILLGFLPNSRPSSSEVKAAYKKKSSGARGQVSASGTYSWVVRSGVPRAHGGGSKKHAFIRIPFLFIVLGTVALGGSSAARAYTRQKEAYPSHNPFLP